MNARANQPIVIDDHLVDVYSMCSGCENPYYVLEIGEAEASKDTELVASNFAARWGENGVTLLQTDAQGDKVLNLSEKSILQFRLQGQDGQNAIKKDAIVRLYLWPLTGWSIGASDCLASCEPYEFNDKICEGQVSCIPEAVVGSSLRNNIIRLRLPTEMSDITSQTTHTITVTSMDTPSIGFFPVRMGAQLTDESDASPHYTTSDGYLMKYPAYGETTGRIVVTGATGYGEKPFKNDGQNRLLVRLRFGATLWAADEDFAKLEVSLPLGYTCTVELATSPDDHIFQLDENKDLYPDHPRGTLAQTRRRADTADGDFESSVSNLCVYKFKRNQAIWARSVIFLQLNVNNPPYPLQRIDPYNVWSISLSGKGVHPRSEQFI